MKLSKLNTLGEYLKRIEKIVHLELDQTNKIDEVLYDLWDVAYGEGMDDYIDIPKENL